MTRKNKTSKQPSNQSKDKNVDIFANQREKNTKKQNQVESSKLSTKKFEHKESHKATLSFAYSNKDNQNNEFKADIHSPTSKTLALYVVRPKAPGQFTSRYRSQEK